MKGYFDYNATTPVFPESLEAMHGAACDHWHNASSLYREGAEVSQLLDDAREDIADRLGCDEPERIIFTSGATEANNAVLAHAARGEGAIAVTAIEHPSLLDPAHSLLGERLSELPVDRQGVLDLDQLRTWLRDTTNPSLVSVMAANNETGSLQPWEEARDLCREREVAFHCDAAQLLGKDDADDLGQCDFVTGSAHKFGGPKGVGFLLIPEDSSFVSLLGGPQQLGHRAGTENYPGVAGMLRALEETDKKLPTCCSKVATDRDWAEEQLEERLPGLEIIGSRAPRLWNTSLLIVPQFDNRRWLSRLNRLGYAVSTGSACSSGKDNPSRVLLATGHDFDAMSRTIRLSAGWDTTREEWEGLVEAMTAVYADLSSGDKPSISLGSPS